MMIKEMVYPNCKFHVPQGKGIAILVIIYMIYILCEINMYSTLSIYSTLIANVFRVDFYLFYDGAVDIQICALLTRSQCKVSDTQVTVKACGPLVY